LLKQKRMLKIFRIISLGVALVLQLIVWSPLAVEVAFAQSPAPTTPTQGPIAAPAVTTQLPQYSGVEDSVKNFLCTPQGDGADLIRCINRLYRFGLSLGGISLVFALVLAGYEYMFSGAGGKLAAKGIVTNAFIGILILAGSFVILRTINPQLTQFRPIQAPIFSASDIPTCGELGLGENCTPEDASTPPIANTAVGGNCRTDFTSEAEARKYMTTIAVKTWAIQGDQKVSQNKNLTVQQCIAAKAKAAMDGVYNSPEKFPIKDLGGYVFRLMTASNKLSNHSFGLAIDINYNENYFKSSTKQVGAFWKPCPADGCSPYSIPTGGSVVKSFKSQGFGWGGDWKNSKDYMHFSCVPGGEQGKCF
jgi:hypothetical protein